MKSDIKVTDPFSREREKKKEPPGHWEEGWKKRGLHWA